MPFSPVEWPNDSRVMLCKVPWDASYKDVVYFSSESARNDYFGGLAQNGTRVIIDKMTYLKPREPVTVNVPYSQCYQYNYLTVEIRSCPFLAKSHRPFSFISLPPFLTSRLTLRRWSCN